MVDFSLRYRQDLVRLSVPADAMIIYLTLDAICEQSS
jgi:hypothetical protein